MLGDEGQLMHFVCVDTSDLSHLTLTWKSQRKEGATLGWEILTRTQSAYHRSSDSKV